MDLPDDTTPDDVDDLTGLDVTTLDGLAEFEHEGNPDVEFVDAPAEDGDAEHGSNAAELDEVDS